MIAVLIALDTSIMVQPTAKYRDAAGPFQDGERIPEFQNSCVIASLFWIVAEHNGL